MDVDGIRAYTAVNASIVTQAAQRNLNTSQPIADDPALQGDQVVASPAAVGSEADISGAKNSVSHKADIFDEKQRGREEAEASTKMIQTAVENANKQLKYSQRMLRCSMHEKTKRIMVQVVNTETDEVLREIPPEKTLDLFAKVLELAGMLYDEKK